MTNHLATLFAPVLVFCIATLHSHKWLYPSWFWCCKQVFSMISVSTSSILSKYLPIILWLLRAFPCRPCLLFSPARGCSMELKSSDWACQSKQLMSLGYKQAILAWVVCLRSVSRCKSSGQHKAEHVFSMQRCRFWSRMPIYYCVLIF